jgi:gamma-glutamyltranspeptidase/glutathione hydrolase
MVVSISPEAAAAGLAVLMEGGNAFDAAIATALVEGLTLPGACGLGGDAFVVLYNAAEGRPYAVNGSGVAPGATSRERFTSRGLTTMPLSGLDSASVPGAPDAYWTVHQRFGSLPWRRLFEPAIRYAEEGLAVSPRLHRTISGSRAKLGQFASSSAVYFPGGEPPAVGSLYRRPAYGRSLRLLAEGGPDAYYRGPIAAEVVRYSQEQGGLFSAEDFAAHRTEVYQPLRTTYHGVEVCETAPPSQGLLVLEMLNILEGFDLAGAGFGTPEAVHLMVEAKKLAFADRLRYAGDPRFVDVPLRQLLDKGFAARRRGEIDPQRAAGNVAGALPETLHGDTSSFVVADGQGNAVSFIHSLSAGFGSGVVAGETGITLNNRAGRGFSLEEGHPNVIAGGKRTMHTLNCYLLLREGALYAVGGTPGGDMQPQWNVQTITNLVDFGMGPQEAVEAPRWYAFPGTDPEHAGKPQEVRLESRFTPALAPGLARRGHQVADLGPWSGGACQLILRQPAPVTGGPDGAPSGAAAGAVLVAGADPRPGAMALGF